LILPARPVRRKFDRGARPRIRAVTAGETATLRCRAAPAWLMAAACQHHRQMRCAGGSHHREQARFPRRFTASHDGQLLIKSPQIPQGAVGRLDPRWKQGFSLAVRDRLKVPPSRRNRRLGGLGHHGKSNPPVRRGAEGAESGGEEGGALAGGAQAGLTSCGSGENEKHLPSRGIQRGDGRLRRYQQLPCSRFEEPRLRASSRGTGDAIGLRAAKERSRSAHSSQKLIRHRLRAGPAVRCALRVIKGGPAPCGWPRRVAGVIGLGPSARAAPLPAGGPPLRAQGQWPPPTTPMRPLMASPAQAQHGVLAIKQASHPLHSCCPCQLKGEPDHSCQEAHQADTITIRNSARPRAGLTDLQLAEGPGRRTVIDQGSSRVVPGHPGSSRHLFEHLGGGQWEEITHHQGEMARKQRQGDVRVPPASLRCHRGRRFIELRRDGPAGRQKDHL